MIDTRVAGEPTDLRAAGAYLSVTLSSGITTLADTVLDQRHTLERGWEGQAGAAFTERATVLGRAGDEISSATAAMGRRLEALAAVLETVQRGMSAVRAEAAAAGLEVRGERILPPPPGDFASGSPELAAAQERAAAYESAAARRDDLLAQWYAAVDGTAAFVRANATDVGQVTLTLLVAGYTGALQSRLSPAMSRQAVHKLAESDRLLSYADDLADALRGQRITPHPGSYAELDDLLARSRLAAEEASEAAAVARNPRLPAALARGVGAVGPLAAGYGVYDDLQHGESPEQAIASQGGGLLAGMAAGGATGAAIGTLGFPVAGTLVGGVVGAIAGVVASGEIDEHYEEQAADRAEAERGADEERLHLMLGAREGLPLYSTPGSDSAYGE